MVMVGTLWSLPAPAVEAAECAAGSTAAELDAFFAADDAAGLAGADYPHAVALPDGRTLWLFQDAFVGTDALLGDDRFAHNAALVQTGNCFEMLPASGGDGTSWIGSWVEDELNTWIWPLDAEIGADGHLWLFLAAVRNERGDGAAAGAEPVGTWRARYRLPDLELIDLEPAEDASNELFGYSIVSDEDWTYLYGHCYRQFLPDGGFDPSCSPHVYLARVPRGRLDNQPWYWSEDQGWTRDRSLRTPVMSAQLTMPVSVERFGDVYVAASDEDDWFGSDVVVRTADAPQGPWREAVRYTPATKCEQCNNYGAFVLPRLERGKVVIAHSNNAWDMEREAFTDASRYRISVNAVSVPGVPRHRSVRALIEADQTTRGQVEETVESPDVKALTIGAVIRVDGPSDGVLVAGRVLVLGLMGLVALAASLGFARSARRIDPDRRHRAVARLPSHPGRPAGTADQKTTVLRPWTRMRCSRWARTARARTVVSRSRPARVSPATSSRWLTRAVSWSMIGPSSRSSVA